MAEQVAEEDKDSQQERPEDFSEDDSDSDEELPEELAGGKGGCNCIWKRVLNGAKISAAPTTVDPVKRVNRFRALSAPGGKIEHDGQEAKEALSTDAKTALATWAAVKPTGSQRDKRKTRKSASSNVVNLKVDSDVEKLTKLIASAKKYKHGQKLPDVKCKDGEFLSVVDSGSVVVVADASKTFPKLPVKQGEAARKGVAYVSASGDIIPNRGEVVVDLKAENGVLLEKIAWQNAPVNMPILSVKYLAKRGSRVNFWNKGGVIKLPDGNRIPFYEAAGVYFVKLKIQPPEGSNLPPFGGQGS